MGRLVAWERGGKESRAGFGGTAMGERLRKRSLEEGLEVKKAFMEEVEGFGEMAWSKGNGGEVEGRNKRVGWDEERVCDGRGRGEFGELAAKGVFSLTGVG